MPTSCKAKASAVGVLGLVPLALTALAAAPASAHGSMGDPVSRVSQCYAEGPESPRSAACKAAVAAGGTQALYDWNGIRIGDAAGRHRQLIPDGKLCSAGNEEFKGLDLARADWPATRVRGGSYTFKYRVTAPHKGTFNVYLTKPGYDPARPPAWSDLDLEHPVATATDPVASGGFYTFSGTLPERSGRHLLYAVWQRSDSPEAFYSCSDVDFGGNGDTGSGSGGTGNGNGRTGSGSGRTESGNGGTTPAPAASAPSDEQIEAGAGRSTIEHHGHGDDDASTSAKPTAAPAPSTAAPANRPKAAGASADLAETGASTGTSYLAIGGAAALALGSAALFLSVRRRAAGGTHRR
ncbi:lytic polysaccharide monooxygenase [Streptomyces sp. 5-8]|uniref:Lytic polysaccharide monooxygenase n=1 Tax=Streptomyces musisoli TaxID=2802280 RepID=A0ABS1P5R0_9ACTN|nr:MULTISPECIES: lytic polysaccharide monooxygenase [Streptomyces]MBL1107702.1 lytic polysaccharide monooxygenase [Streptomyces musisoli]MBY8845851.1 lytic polysaccharide monooxygenase [Streptomyces sp. SP2-10]